MYGNRTRKIKKVTQNPTSLVSKISPSATYPTTQKFLTIWAGINMGMVIMLWDAYIKQCINEHLGDSQFNKNISGNNKEKIEKLNSKFDDFILDNKNMLGRLHSSSLTAIR